VGGKLGGADRSPDLPVGAESAANYIEGRWVRGRSRCTKRNTAGVLGSDHPHPAWIESNLLLHQLFATPTPGLWDGSGCGFAPANAAAALSAAPPTTVAPVLANSAPPAGQSKPDGGDEKQAPIPAHELNLFCALPLDAGAWL